MTSALPINIDDLLHLRGVEGPRVEFKASWDEDTTGSQVLRTLCAFANDLQNLNGGYIVIGVAEQNGVAQLPSKGLEPAQLDAIQKWIRGNCKRIEPEYQPVLSPEVVDGRHILVIWAPGSNTRPHQAPESLQKGAARRYYVRLGSETVVAQGDVLTTLMQQTAKVPFDDQRALNVPLEVIRESKVREFLSDIRSRLLEEPDAREAYRRLFVSARVNGHEVPRNVGLLFFSDNPEEWFRGARIDVVQFAAGPAGDVLEERIFRGPLHVQLRDCLTYLRNLSTQHLEKHGDRPEVKGWVSYPLAALEESLVNAVYHRSYEGVVEPTKVYLYPDRVEIISYPGPVPGIQPEHLKPGARIPPVPARNRRIGEFLKELRLAEGRGTGVPKVFSAMAQNGSPPPRLEFDEGRTYFRVILPAHPEYIAISALRDAAHMRALGDEYGALQRIQAAFAENPSSSALASALIDEHARAGNLVAARQVYEQFVFGSAGQGGARVIAALSKAYLDSGRQDEAKAILDRMPALLSAREACDAAILERRAGRPERAHQLFERAGDAILNDVRALHEFARTKIRLADNMRSGLVRRGGRFQRDARLRLLRDAREMLRRVLQMDAPPIRHAWAWFELGRVLRWLKAPETEVRQAFEEARRLAPEEPRFQSEFEKLG
jgi:ATP-dependent DNA helicase RecG